ncbi:major pollen allergen Ole e 10-like, partial [Beta vulgaris subsp. vulgaris]|uniref:major pollen allergen Ole e 10-like n=1 Tax=Beta vulgaris subsp. vulgaris TaxID=3555 RepID=UPI002548B728
LRWQKLKRVKRGHSLSLSVKLFLLFLALQQQVEFGEGVWCVSRSGASDDALQSALDYVCAAGADCTPIQQSGLCFLPNTPQAHASYAFNSFYQRNHMSASSCDFSATATLAQTDPSYGSCIYPASPRYIYDIMIWIIIKLPPLQVALSLEIRQMSRFICERNLQNPYSNSKTVHEE